MEEHARNTKRNPENVEFWLKNLSVYFSAVSFWIAAFIWNYFLADLELVPRLGLGAALSWVVFLHVEAIGMILMTMMREKWRSDARLEARLARLEAREEVREAQAEARNAEVRAARAETREAQAEAREAQAEAREAKAQETIRDLQRQLREARGEGANGAEDA